MIPAAAPPPPPFYTHSFHLRTHYTTRRHTSGEDAHKDAIRVEVAAQKVPTTHRRLKLQSLKCVYACQVRLQNVAFCCRGRRAGTKIQKNNNNNIKWDLPRAEVSERRERSSCCPVLATATDCQRQQRPTRRLVPASVPGESARVSNAGNAHQAAL